MQGNARIRLTALAFVVAASSLLPIAPRAAASSDGEYYYNAGRRLPIFRSATRFALHKIAGAPEASLLERANRASEVRAAREIASPALVEVTVEPTAKSTAVIARLAREADAELLPVFYESGLERDASTLFLADDMLVQFRPDVARETIDDLNARYGVAVVEPLAYAENGFRLRVGGSDLERNALSIANTYYETGLCIFSHPNFLASRRLFLTPNDPQFTNQWHLKNTGQGGGTVGADVKAEAAWDVTLGSTSVTVAVADTGIDVNHEDLNVMVDGVAKVRDARDVVHGDNDPFPQPGDADRSHGTAASGVAVAASNNGVGVSGAAPKCRLMPIQLYAESTFTPNATEADAFTWAADHGADVMSNSWGPDNADAALPDATRAAIDHATSTGRGGKGMVIFFAAGNSNFDLIHNNYANYSGVVAVAASTNFDTKASYSNFGAAISIAAPSNGGSRSITTTDVTGSIGYSTGNYTSTFGGTSSACPLAAGVAALVISANPNLTWRQVKSVLEQSADKIDVAGGAYDALGHSNKYGYGRVNARRAVELAAAGGPDTPGISSSGAYFLRNSNSSGPANAVFTFGSGAPATISLAGDWDGNGTDTIGIYDPAAAAFFLKNSNAPGAADTVFSFGPADAVAIAGDWDGNGTTTVGIYVPATGSFFLKNTNAPGAADVVFSFGPTGSTLAPLVGDWDGNGTDTIGLYDPSTGAFFLKNASTPGGADLTFTYGAGSAGVLPVTGDWNNDGIDSIGLYDTLTGAFFVRNANSSGNADWTYTFGAGNAQPLVGNWDGQ